MQFIAEFYVFSDKSENSAIKSVSFAIKSSSLNDTIAKKAGIRLGTKLTKEMLEKLEEIAVEESNRISSSISSK